MLEKNRLRLSALEMDVRSLSQSIKWLEESRQESEKKVERIWLVLCSVAKITGCQIKIEPAQPEQYVVTMKGGEESRKDNVGSVVVGT